MVRKLVTIRTIDKIEGIPNADRIVKATLGGWDIVIGKDEFTVNSRVLMFEVDSYLPIKEPFMFLKDRCYKKMSDGTEGLRLRTIKLKKVTSQGLIMNLQDFPDIDFSDEDKDYAEELGVTLYEPPIPAQLSGQVHGQFPSHLVSKTDQERAQNLLEWFTKYKDVEFEKTLKADGSSMTVISHNESERPLMVCSRNLELDLSSETTFIKLMKKYELDTKLQELNINIAIQGEAVGEGINGNHMNLTGHDFLVFDMFDIDKQVYYSSEERLKMCEQLGLKHVEVVNKKCKPFNNTMQDLIQDAYNARYGERKGEGFVYKSLEPIDGQLISFKVINNKYLLAEE